MAKKDKFEYSTDYLANIHAPAVKVEEVAKVEEVEPIKEEPTKEEDEQVLITETVEQPKVKAKAKSKRKPKA